MGRADLTPGMDAYLRQNLQDPAFVASWLDAMQYTACAGLLQFPNLITDCQGYLFASDNPLYLAVYKAVRCGAQGLWEVFNRTATQPESRGLGYDLSTLYIHPVSRGEAERSIARIKRFLSWQYRQEKAKRKAT